MLSSDRESGFVLSYCERWLIQAKIKQVVLFSTGREPILLKPTTVEEGRNCKNPIDRSKVPEMNGCTVGVIMGGYIARWIEGPASGLQTRGRHCNGKLVNVRLLVKADLCTLKTSLDRAMVVV